MSPQMNGQPRDSSDAGASTEFETSAAATSIPGDRQALEAVNIDGVVQTTVTKEDAKLAPLFAQAAASDFRARWNLVQRDFVDDPKGSVLAADKLVDEVTRRLAETFAKQRSELEAGLDQQQAATTENLRVALRQYRSFFERLLSI